MLDFIGHALIAISSICIWDFCTVKKPRGGDPPATDLEKVCNLYNNIRRIKASNAEYRIQYIDLAGSRWIVPPQVKTVIIITSSVLETIKTLIKYKCQNLIQTYRTPARLQDSNIMFFPYYHNGTWYKALVEHKLATSSIVKVTDEFGNDLTTKIKEYMGPAEDFYGNKHITPAHMNLSTLIFTIILSSGLIYHIDLKADDPVSQIIDICNSQNPSKQVELESTNASPELPNTPSE